MRAFYSPQWGDPCLCCGVASWEHAHVTWEEASPKPTLLAWVATLWQLKKSQECQGGRSCALASSLTWELSLAYVPATTHQLSTAQGKGCSLVWRWECFSLSFIFTSLNLFISPHVIRVTIKGNLPVLLNFFLHTMDSDLSFPFQLFLDFPHPLRDTPFCRSL